MANERVTEEIFRRHIQQYGAENQIVEEQISDDIKVRKALSKASKHGSGVGKPEFIVRIQNDPDFLIVVECKTDPAKHISQNLDKPSGYAVDGALLYSEHLAKHFDVIAIAISGTNKKNIKISTYRQLRGTASADLLVDEFGPVEKLLSVNDYRRLIDFDPAVRRRTQDELMKFSQRLHNDLRDNAKLSENEKPLAVSGCLLALRDEAFKNSWRKYKNNTLGRELIAALQREIESAVPEVSKQRVMLHAYRFLEVHPELNRISVGKTDWPLRALIEAIEENVRPFLDTYKDIDVIGQFYGEFLRYTGGDKKGLGIVLTPRHLTELFVKMARVGLKDTVIDTCCGTGGFLIAALAEMDAKAAGNAVEREQIRKHRLIGVEQQPQMYALAASNMILRGDGKANLFQGNCFDQAIIDNIIEPDKKRFNRPSVGLINPPFSQQGQGLHELDFVFNLLEDLRPNGRGIIVLPMSCAIEPHPMRKAILDKHTLIASVTLPNDIFHPVGVVTCALVFEAHQPHADHPIPTWFGAWKNDGFLKQKKKGRVDLQDTWTAIRDGWLHDFHTKAVVTGKSVMHTVGHEDEWCAEAYMETDYSTLTREDFDREIKRYAAFRILNEEASNDSEAE